MTNKQKRLLPAILLWLAIIWIMSAQTGDISARNSSIFERELFALFAGVPKLKQFLEQVLVVVPIRKVMHFLEYAVLAVLVSGFLKEDKHQLFRDSAAKCTLCFCTAAAALDELHQFYVPGRNGNPADVLLDIVGAFSGILIYRGMIVILSLRRKQ